MITETPSQPNLELPVPETTLHLLPSHQREVDSQDKWIYPGLWQKFHSALTGSLYMLKSSLYDCWKNGFVQIWKMLKMAASPSSTSHRASQIDSKLPWTSYSHLGLPTSSSGASLLFCLEPNMQRNETFQNCHPHCPQPGQRVLWGERSKIRRHLTITSPFLNLNSPQTRLNSSNVHALEKLVGFTPATQHNPSSESHTSIHWPPPLDPRPPSSHD